ncbi:MAG: hypothetical protein KDE03_01910 [Rhodobacteraceae bacterium]|nr:hypothetical protein [Paracoccaceae bacterium]
MRWGPARFAIALAGTLLITGKANAFCTRGFGYDFGSKLNAELDYLVCLHNEQNDALNSQADIVNNHASVINDLSNRQDRISEAMRDLAGLIDEARRDYAALEDRVTDLEYRIQALE